MYRKSFDLCLCFWVDLGEPSVLHLSKAGIVAGGEVILERKTGSYTDLGLGLLVGELGGERLKVTLL